MTKKILAVLKWTAIVTGGERTRPTVTPDSMYLAKGQPWGRNGSRISLAQVTKDCAPMTKNLSQ